MKNQTSVSIIIPAYNAEKWIERCIKSCIDQTYKNIEIIIINDGSQDRTDELCQYYVSMDNRIIYKNIDNAGVSNARKLGLDISNSSYILFLDSDDYINNDCIEILISYKDYDLIIGQANYVNNHNKILSNTKFEIKKNIISSYLRGKLPTSLWPILFKKKILDEEYLISNLKVSEDFIILSQIITKTKKIKVINNIIYNQVKHSLSTTANHSAIHFKDNYRAHLFVENNLIKKLDRKYANDIKIFQLNYLYNLIVNFSPYAKYQKKIIKSPFFLISEISIKKKIILSLYLLKIFNKKNYIFFLHYLKRK
ncbi:glycosyltransferase family 2 protein [Proteus penneri]|uniref:Putative glycosyltransferase EpsJ n=1 Tax=Proteus penneri TaxID=102862 RepID=A0A0G4QFV4_9GAMM|nr:glycosyltransferase family 2 protein [Proteus penneri]CRL64476.1 putative glycosyltransferase EpsJ [Proteus penneri]